MKKAVLLALVIVLSLLAQYQPPAGGGNATTLNGVNATPVTIGTLPTICSTVALTAQSVSIATTNLLCNGVQAPAGVYRLNVQANTTNLQAGSGTVTFTPTWTTAGTSETSTLITLSMTAGNTFPVITGTGSGVKVFRHDGTTNITWATTYAATGQYDLSIVLERLL